MREQIVDFVGRESKSQGHIDVFQRRAPARQHLHDRERLRVVMAEQRLHLIERAEHRLGHAVVNEFQDLMAVERGFAGKNPRRSPLDAAYCLETASARDIGRLGGPRRDGAQTRHAEQHAALGRRRGLAVLEQALQYIGFPRIERALGFDEMPVFCGCDLNRSVGSCEAGVEFVEPERGSGAAAA